MSLKAVVPQFLLQTISHWDLDAESRLLKRIEKSKAADLVTLGVPEKENCTEQFPSCEKLMKPRRLRERLVSENPRFLRCRFCNAI